MHGRQGCFIIAGLEGYIAKAISGEVRTKNKQFLVIIPLKARIAKDGLVHLVENRKMIGSPHRLSGEV